MNNLIPFFVFTVFLVICVIVGSYKDSLFETNSWPEEQAISIGQKLKTYHSLIELFASHNYNVPRVVASLLVYARFNVLFACAGSFLISGYSTGENIASLFGRSIAFNILGKIIYMLTQSSQKSLNESRKNSDN